VGCRVGWGGGRGGGGGGGGGGARPHEPQHVSPGQIFKQNGEERDQDNHEIWGKF